MYLRASRDASPAAPTVSRISPVSSSFHATAKMRSTTSRSWEAASFSRSPTLLPVLLCCSLMSDLRFS